MNRTVPAVTGGAPAGREQRVLKLRKRKKEKLPVLRPGGGLAYLASPEEIRELIRSGCARSFDGGKNKQRLYGCVLVEGPSRPHGGTKYVHCAAVSETWIDRRGELHERGRFEPNVRGVYTLKPISHLSSARFHAVLFDVGAGGPQLQAKLAERRAEFREAA